MLDLIVALSVGLGAVTQDADAESLCDAVTVRASENARRLGAVWSERERIRDALERVHETGIGDRAGHEAGIQRTSNTIDALMGDLNRQLGLANDLGCDTARIAQRVDFAFQRGD